MNSRTRFQTIALKILGVLLIAVGVNQLVSTAQSRWTFTPSDRCPLFHDRAENQRGPWDHRLGVIRMNIDRNRVQTHDVNREVHLAMESVRHELDQTGREMEDIRQERQEAVRDMRMERMRFR